MNWAPALWYNLLLLSLYGVPSSCQFTNQIAKFSGVLWPDCEMWVAWITHPRGNIYTMEINCKSGVSACLFGATQPIPSVKTPEFPLMVLPTLPRDWMTWTSHTTSLTFSLFIFIKDGAGVADLQVYFHTSEILLYSQPSSAIPTYNTTKPR